MRFKLVATMATILFVFGAVRMHCQTSSGSIAGEIRDKNGANIAQAAVSITQVDTGRIIRVRTNANGAYNVPALEPGHYRIACTKQGFGTTEINDVEVHTAETLTLNMTLQIGSVNEQVTIVADEDLMAHSTPTLSATIPGALITDLPLPDRSALEVATLIGGVQGDPQYEGGIQSEIPGIFTQPITPGASLAIGGGRPGTTSQLVDGFDTTLSAYPRAGITLSRASINDVTVQRGAQEAEYGRNGGGIVNQATKSGSNQYHGIFDWRHEEPFFEAATYDSPYPAAQHQNLFTALLSGPVPTWHDKSIDFSPSRSHKTFFLLSYEPEWVENKTYSRARLLTPGELSGNLNNSLDILNQTVLRNSGYAAAIAANRVGPNCPGSTTTTCPLWYQFALNAQNFPTGTGTQLPSSSYKPIPNNDLSAQVALNPVAKFIYGFMPTPTSGSQYAVFLHPDGSYDPDGNNGLSTRGVSNSDERFNIRLDHSFSDTDQVFARYTYVPVVGNRYDYLGPTSPANQIPTDTIKSKNAALHETHIFSGTVVNEFRLSYLSVERNRLPPPASTTKDFGAAAGLTPAIAGAGFPFFNLFAPVGSGGSSTDGGKSVDANFGVGDDISILVGQHTLKFGGEFLALQLNRRDDSFLYGGQYNFNADESNNGTGGSALASLDLGLVHDYNVATPQSYYYRWKYYAFYAQDDWKIRSNVTISVGLRYNLEMPRKEINNLQGRFDPLVTGTLNGIGVTGGFAFSGQNGTPTSLWGANYLGFEPRIGVAYAVTPRVTARASYGLMHTPLTGQGNNVIPNLADASQDVGPNNGGVNPTATLNLITNPIAPIAQVTTPHTGPLFNFSSSAYLPVISQSNKVPYAQIYSMALNFEVGHATTIEAVYTGNKGTHLYDTPNSTNVPPLNTLLTGIQQNLNFSASNVSNPYTGVKETYLQSLNPYQQFYNNPIQTALGRDATSIYHGFYINAVHRPTNGLVYFASYTWSKSIDDASSGSTDFDVVDSFGFAKPQSPYSTRDGERALSTFDLPSRVTGGYLYLLPFGRSRTFDIPNRFWNALGGGWSTSGILSVQSGSPLWITLGTNGYFVSSPAGTLPGSANVGKNGTAIEDANLRPSFAPGVKIIKPNWRSDPLGITSTGGYLNPAAFVTPGSLGNPQFGNVPRTMGNARNPATAFFDASLRKQLPTGSDRYQLQLQMDALNALNHPTFFMTTSASASAGRVVTTALPTAATGETYAAGFGKLTEVAAGRIIALGIRLTF